MSLMTIFLTLVVILAIALENQKDAEVMLQKAILLITSCRIAFFLSYLFSRPKISLMIHHAVVILSGNTLGR